LIGDHLRQSDEMPRPIDDNPRKSLGDQTSPLSANQHPQALIETIKDLIAELENDAATQLAAFEKAHREFAASGTKESDQQREFQTAAQVMDRFESWCGKTASLVFQSSDPDRLRREFVAQTAYLVVVRMLLVRIMEDKNLLPRVLTDGGLALWFRLAEPHYLALDPGRSTGTDYLLDLAYASAQRIYAHFYQKKSVFDWYRPDRIAVVRVLHRLAGFDLRDIDRDIIGTVYNQYVEERHKHESGMYFTPPPVVEFMLDRAGYVGGAILGKKLVDLSCGSGTFLVGGTR